MGIIFSRFRKKSASEQLENVEEEIKELEACSADLQLRHQKMIKQLRLYSSGLCVLFAAILYFHISSELQNVIVLIVLLLFSLIYIINKIISWYYKRKTTFSYSKLKDLKKEKKRLVDEIMDKETYKVAKEILERYAPETLPPKYSPRFNTGVTATKSAIERPQQNLVANVSSAGMIRPQQPKAITNQADKPNLNSRFQNQSQLGLIKDLGMRQPTNFFFPSKSYAERFFEYLIGDGPSSRYALICSNCSTHNGMALQEEFEYINFRCYACFMFNPARKQRPIAPKLEDVQDDREPDSCSSSASGDLGTLRIEEIEDKEKEDELKRQYYNTTVEKLEKRDSQDIENEVVGRKTSNGNGEEELMTESQNEEQFEILQSSSILNDISENTENNDSMMNGIADSEKT